MWRNWAGQQRCEPLEELHPSDAGQLADAVASAAERGLNVRVAGAGHSFTDAVCTSDVLLVLDRMRAVLEVDRSRGSVRVQAGCTLGELSERLRRHGLALRNLGDIDRQTVAGALATGTHGTGLRLPTLAEEAAGFELLDGLPQLAREHEHFEAFIFPYTGVALPPFSDRTDRPPTPSRPLKAWVREVVIANRMFEGLLAAGRAVPVLVAPLNRLAAAATSRSERCRTAIGLSPAGA